MSASLPRVALVTGSGTKRVGWYVADALAGQGYTVAVHDHTAAAAADETAEDLRGRGVEAATFQADLTDGEAARGRMWAVLDSQRPCPLCAATLRVFVSILGAEAGNLALKVLATGGVSL